MSAPPQLPVRCRRAGAGRAVQRVLLLHGMGGGVGVWDPMDEAMAAGFELWDCELPWSMGASPRWAFDRDPAAWLTAAVDGFVRATYAPPDLIVAHSFAANLALEAAGTPAGPGSVPTVLVNPFFRPAPEDFEWGSIAHYARGFQRMFDEGLRLRAGARFTDAERERLAERLCVLTGPYPWLRFYDVFLRAALRGFEEFTAPTLLVGGDQDRGAEPEGVRALGRRIPNARVEILDQCGHFPMIEQPGRLAGLLAEFAQQGEPAVPASAS
ncbi:MAG TPA: alpha/beta hydrolase [Actinospica sp.]|jgi:pimeloyl-ACP methyl ester carboxylesterase|nr:alpha/beta hydrolase [Actinospica sp.]